MTLAEARRLVRGVAVEVYAPAQRGRQCWRPGVVVAAPVGDQIVVRLQRLVRGGRFLRDSWTEERAVGAGQVRRPREEP